MRRLMSSFVRAVAAIGVAGVAASAWAQDYTVTTATGLLETRPAAATQLSIASNSSVESMRNATVTMPFQFPYYGMAFQTITISGGGFILPRAVSAITNQMNNGATNGHDVPSGGFPYTGLGLGDQYVDGLIAPLWGHTEINATGISTGFVYVWTTGAAPTRHFVVSWENAKVTYTPSTPITYQLQLFETTGRIVFAYSPTGSYPNQFGGYVCGLDSAIDLRYTAPLGPGRTIYGYPGGDLVFDPRTVTCTGTVLYDKLVSDSFGIGSSILSNRPLAGLRVELRRNSDALTYANATTAADGSFSITGIGVPAAPAGALAVLSQNAACIVGPSAAPAIWTATNSVSLASGASLGTFALGAAGDPNGDLRAALNVASDFGVARAWAVARTTDAIPQLAVTLDPAASLATSYQPAAGPNPASMRVASRQATNPDMWDDAVITKAYGRHVLVSIAGVPTTEYDDRFDAVSDAQNAFAEGFGCYLWAAVSGSTQAIDGTSATTATVYDLENPAISVARGPNVAGCVAGALFDLVDPANETTDPIDGTSTTDNAFRAADAVTVAPTAATFLQAWVNAGYDAADITRVFTANGALVDDAREPNDSVSEVSALGAAGFAPMALVLNRFNEDWFSVTLPASAASLAADAKYDQVSTGATVAVEIRDAGGALLATGTLIPATGAVHAATGPLLAGTYKIGVKHVSGGTVPTYVFQAYVPPTMDAAPLRDWTVGRVYDFPLGVADGIPPYTLSTPSSAMPLGMGLNVGTLRAAGTPTVVGTYAVNLQLKDSGDPANVVLRDQTVVIHDVFRFPIAPFVGFPAGGTIDTTLPTHEGTPPFTLSMSSGALTSGLAFGPNSLHVTGTATLGPSSAFELDGVDVAGSADHVATRAVVAVQITGKRIPADLAAGVDACGWWFDAVKGSTVTFAVATGKGLPKRALTGAFLAPDRSLVTTGKIVGRLGGVSASKLVCPQSGRYYFVASSADAAGLATQLLGTATVRLPRAGKGLDKAFAPNATTTIEFGAVPGSTATVRFAGARRAALVAKVVSVTDPNGVPVPPVALATMIKSTAIGGTLTLPLPVGGTWTVVLGATSTSGTPGRFTYSYVVKQLKGAVYTAD